MRRTLTTTPSVPVPTLTATAVSQTEIDLASVYAGIPFSATFGFESAPSATGPFTVIANVASSLVASFADTTLSASQTRFYRVRINCRDGRTTAYSPVVSATTQAAVIPPTSAVGSGLLAVGYGNQGSYGQTAIVNYYAMMDVNLLEPFEGGGSVYTPNFTTWKAVVDGIHAARVALGYSTINDVINYYNALIGGNSTLISLFNHIQANQPWLLRATYPSGTIQTWASMQATNFYPGGGNDSSGRTIQQYLAAYWDAVGRTGNASGILTGGNNNNAANTQGSFSDDNIAHLALTADYARTGSATPSNTTTNNNYMAAQVGVITELVNLFPAGKIWINGNGNYGALSNIAAYNGITTGGCFLENALGDANTYEGSRGPAFSGMVTAILQVQALAATASGVWCLSHNSMGVNGQDATSATNTAAYQAETFQSMRYGYCASKAYGGLYSVNANATNTEYNPVNSTKLYLDEWSWNPTTGVCTGIGGVSAASLGARGTSHVGYNPVTLANGVIRADYDGCTFLVNPLENGARTFSLGGAANFHFLSGTQSPSVNTGGLITPSTSITMPARSGRVLRAA